MMQFYMLVDNEFGIPLHHGAVILWIVTSLLLVLACGENLLDLCTTFDNILMLYFYWLDNNLFLYRVLA